MICPATRSPLPDNSNRSTIAGVSAVPSLPSTTKLPVEAAPFCQPNSGIESFAPRKSERNVKLPPFSSNATSISALVAPTKSPSGSTIPNSVNASPVRSMTARRIGWEATTPSCGRPMGCCQTPPKFTPSSFACPFISILCGETLMSNRSAERRRSATRVSLVTLVRTPSASKVIGSLLRSFTSGTSSLTSTSARPSANVTGKAPPFNISSGFWFNKASPAVIVLSDFRSSESKALPSFGPTHRVEPPALMAPPWGAKTAPLLSANANAAPSKLATPTPFLIGSIGRR